MRNRYKRTPLLPSYRVDVIVIGSGFAGLAAAIEATEAGASVAVVEKMMAPGGNSIISDGGIAAPGTSYQAAAGIKDTPQLMYEDMMSAGEGLNYPELVRVVTTGAKDAFLWSKDYLGVQYKDRVDIFGGHSVPRCYTPDSISGSALIKRQLAKLQELQVPIFLSTYVESLISDQSGRIAGAQVVAGYRFNRPGAGKALAMGASKGIVVAAGGFGGDVAFRQAQDPRLDCTIQTTNKASATAEIIKECVRIGANPVQLSRIQLSPWTSPDERGFGIGPLFGDYVVLPFGILIDPATGGRFVNELGNRKLLAEAIMQKQQPVIGIADSAGVLSAGWDLQKALQKGVVKVFGSIEDLARDYKIDPLALKSSLTRFNAMVIEGKDHDFNKLLVKKAAPLEKPPFYAMRFWPKVHHTMGGLQIDSSARVINRDQQSIRGLFAAGEVTGGVHGACRLGSCAITDCLVMGRIAGRNAAASLA